MLFNSIQELHEYFNDRCECLLKETATNPVFGDGNPDSDIVFIGEAPGANEDKEGRPFVGRAGKLLNEMLDSVGLSRGDVYITNIVKYRPPNNRDPYQNEKEQCSEWLKAELNFIAPNIVVFLGRHSMGYFLPELKISEAHGKLVHKTIDGLDVEYFMPMYHPAAALYNPSMRDTLFVDFRKLMYAQKTLEKSS